jgi:membrane-associated phospholipid phosphatase
MAGVRRTLEPLGLATALALVAPSVTWASPAAADGDSRAVLDAPLVAGPVLRPQRLEVGGERAALVTGAALMLWGAAEVERATDDVLRCRWCDPGGFDRWSRRQLRWGNPGAASDASDVLMLGVSLGSATAVGWLAAREGGRREVVEDVFLVAAAVALNDAVTRGVQHSVGRIRPQPWDAGTPRTDRDLRAFFSGHTSRAFAAAAAATQVARLRGRSGWGWVAAVGFTAAAATGYLRVAGDDHWATDVLVGAAVGTAIGWAIPSASLRPVTRAGGVAVVPAPGGLAIVF